jgi:hypothetical protein
MDFEGELPTDGMKLPVAFLSAHLASPLQSLVGAGVHFVRR